jgi:hypothetical protein
MNAADFDKLITKRHVNKPDSRRLQRRVRPRAPRLAAVEFDTHYYSSLGEVKSFLQLLVIDWFRQVAIDARLQSLIAFLI